MNGTGDWLPLFPLDVVLLPGALLPLHIFEPRYRALVRRCEAGSEPFGMIRLAGGDLARVGCTARIIRVLQAYPDGRSDILSRGERRFRVAELREHADGYVEGRIEAVDDRPGTEADSADLELLDRLYREFVELAEEEPAPLSEDEPAGTDAARVSFAMAARAPLGTEERQALLEMLSERGRVEALLGHLARLLPRLRAHEQNRRKIRGNGKPAPAGD
jgi:ATP-dependent Lon protease